MNKAKIFNPRDPRYIFGHKQKLFANELDFLVQEATHQSRKRQRNKPKVMSVKNTGWIFADAYVKKPPNAFSRLSPQ